MQQSAKQNNLWVILLRQKGQKNNRTLSGIDL
jgi:hypothetical protein